MKSDNGEKVKGSLLFLVGVAAHLLIVFTLFANALGLDPSKVSLG